jgi:hypothetical protein
MQRGLLPWSLRHRHALEPEHGAPQLPRD